MIAFAFALALTTLQSVAPADQAAREAEYMAEVLGELRRCGVAEAPSRFEYMDYLQEYELVLDGPGLQDSQVQCLANTPLMDGLSLTFTDARLYDVYSRTHLARPDVWARIETIGRRHGEMDREWWMKAPRLQPDQTLAAYTAEVETYCDLAPGTLLDTDEGRRRISIGQRGDSQPVEFRQFSCVTAVLSMTDLDGLGVQTLVIGRDAGP